MKDIREILEALGLTYKKGYMTCPSCGEQKLTASEKRNVATCWSCGQRWWPGKGQKNAAVSWGTVIVRPLAKLCLGHLAESHRTVEWLSGTRRLGVSAAWLRHHGVGAHPGPLDLTQVIAEAKCNLREDRQRALAAAADEKKARGVTAMFEEEAKRLDAFVKDKLQPLFRDSAWKGSAVFVYEDSNGDPISLNVRNFAEERDKRKVCYRLQPVEGRRGVFFPLMDSASYWDESDVNAVIFEGEVNWLQFMAQWGRWSEARGGQSFALAGMAVSGKNGADAHTIAKLMDGYPPTVVYDRDALDSDTGKRGGYALVEAVNWKTACYAVTTRTKDMDDYIKEWNPSPEEVKKLLSSAEYLSRPFEAVKEDIDQATKNGNSRFVEREVTQIVMNDMDQRGDFYNVNYGVFVERMKGRNNIVEIRHGHRTWSSFVSQYGIEPGEKLANVLGKNIGIRTEDPEFARRNRIRTLFQMAFNNLYISEYGGTVIKITADGGISRILNGDESILFRQQHVWKREWDRQFLEMTPFSVDVAKASQSKAGMRLVEGSLLDRYILDTVRYTNKGIKPSTAKQLLQAYILGIFFRDQFKTKVFPTFDGPAGAGKNSIGYFLGLLLVGERFHVNPMPEDARSLAEQMIGVPYAAFDEWDSSNQEVERKLKSLSTSPWEKRRELYTTCDQVTLECEAEVMLSTNSNPARKAATSQRLLLFDVASRQDGKREKAFKSLGMELGPAFIEHRDEIWTELVGMLANVMRTFYLMEIQATHFRMADFGCFFQSVAEHEGWGKEADEMLSEMQDRQISLALDKSLVANLLQEMFRKAPLTQGQFHTARNWAGLLGQYIAENDKDAKAKLTPSYLGHVLSVNADIFKEGFRMQVQEDKHNGNRYAFWLPDSKVAAPAPPVGDWRHEEFTMDDLPDALLAPMPVAGPH